MFDTLNEIRKSWSENKFITIYDPEDVNFGTYLVLPTQLFQKYHLEVLSNYSSIDMMVILSYEFSKRAELPLMKNIFTGISSIYPVVHLTNHQHNDIAPKFTLSISASSQRNPFDHESIITTIHSLVSLIEQFEIDRVSQYKLINNFGATFDIPGRIQLVSASFGLLKKSNTIIEVSLALSQITDYLESVILIPIVNEKGQLPTTKDTMRIMKVEKVTTADKKTIVNLWRSIKNVPKSEIAT